MRDEIMNTLTEQSQALFSPFMEANELVMGKLQKLVDLQINAVPTYAELHLDQVRKAGSVKDADSLKQFWDEHMSASSKLRDKLVADSQAVSDLGVSLLTELGELAEKNASTLATTVRKSA